MYLLVDKDGTVTESDELPAGCSWDCWPTVIKIEMYVSGDMTAFVMSKDGWKSVPDSSK